MLRHLVRNARRIVHTKRQNGKTIISIHDDHSKRREKERRQCNNVWAAKKVFFSLQERIWMGTLRLRNRRDTLSEVFSLATNLVLNESRKSAEKCDPILASKSCSA